MSVELPIDAMPRPRVPALSWPAVLAALTVAVAVQLLLALAGLAAGVYSPDAVRDGHTIALWAAVWGAGSMVLVAAIGGYIAGRSSGLRRSSDGVIHGVVAWAALTLFYAALATTALGELTSGLFGMLRADNINDSSAAAAVGVVGEWDRALRALGEVGLSAEQARLLLEQMARGSAPEGIEAMGSMTLWLALAILLSFVAATVGGLMGARGGRRTARHAPLEGPLTLE